MPPSPVAAALTALGYRLESLGGGNEAYVRLLRRGEPDGAAAVVTAAGDASVPAPGETAWWGCYLAWTDGYPSVLATFGSVARFAGARDHRRALEAWSAAETYGSAGAPNFARVTDPDAVARRMSDLGASDALFGAASVAWASGAVVMYEAGRDGAFVGLFGHQLAHVDLSREAFWLGPGAWVAPLPGVP